MTQHEPLRVNEAHKDLGEELTATEAAPVEKVEKVEMEAIPLGPETQAIIILGIN